MIQVIKMSDEEKFKMYMEVPHEELVRMKIEEERLMEIMENERPQYYSTQPLFTLTAGELETLEMDILPDSIEEYETHGKWSIDRLGFCKDLLYRIKQWRDEQKDNDNH